MLLGFGLFMLGLWIGVPFGIFIICLCQSASHWSKPGGM